MMRQRNRRGSSWGLFALIPLMACGGSSSNTSQTATTQTPATTLAQAPPPAAPRQAHAATFVEQAVPSQMVADADYMVSIRMRNTGTDTWSATDNYRIGSINPPDNEVWGLRRVSVPTSVSPGAEATFGFALKAPRTPGEYNFQWRMVQDGVEWFGDPTPNVLIAVSAGTTKEPR